MADTPEPKANTVQLQKEVNELKEAVKALLVAMQDVIKFNGREHMPEGKYMGVEF